MRIRLRATAIAALAIVVGGAATVGILTWNEAVTPPGGFAAAGPVSIVVIGLATSVVAVVSASLGVACAPGRILENVASRRSFAIGMGLGGLAVAYALVLPLFFITWPLAALFAVFAVVHWRAAFRVARPREDAAV